MLIEEINPSPNPKRFSNKKYLTIITLYTTHIMTTTAFLHEFDATVIEHGIISISNRLKEGIDQKDLTKIGRALCTYAYIKEEIPIELSKKHKLPPKVVAAEKLMLAWQQSLYVGDSADIYDEQYDTFYEGKITSRTGNIISVHFLGWKGFDIDVDITVTPIYPINTITVPKRKASDGLVNTATQQSSAIIEPTEVVDEAEIKPTITTASGRTVKLKMAPIAEVKPVRDPNKKKETILELDGRECNTDDNEFLCFECGFLEHPAKSDMVLCDGACLRTAHYLCLSPVDKKSYDSLVRKVFMVILSIEI